MRRHPQSKTLTCAVVLAAGKSRRMGCQKLLLPLGGIPIIRRVVDAILASPCDRTYVVVGDDGPGIRRALKGCEVEFVVNRSERDDMLTSVRCGLEALPAACGSILLALGDQAGLSPHLIARLLAAAQTTGRGLIVPVYCGQRGHPLLFSARFMDEVRTEFDETGLRGLPTKYPDQVLEIPAESRAVLEDIDTPVDYDQQRTAFE